MSNDNTPTMNDNNGDETWDRCCVRAATACLLRREAELIEQGAAETPASAPLSIAAMRLQKLVMSGVCRTERMFRRVVTECWGEDHVEDIVSLVRFSASVLREPPVVNVEAVVEALERAPKVPDDAMLCDPIATATAEIKAKATATGSAIDDDTADRLARIAVDFAGDGDTLAWTSLDGYRIVNGSLEFGSDQQSFDAFVDYMGRMGWSFDLNKGRLLTCGDISVVAPPIDQVDFDHMVVLTALVAMQRRLQAEADTQADLSVSGYSPMLRSTRAEREAAIAAVYPDAYPVEKINDNGLSHTSLSRSVVNPDRLAIDSHGGIPYMSACTGVALGDDLCAVFHPDAYASQVPVFAVMRWLRINEPKTYNKIVEATSFMQDEKRRAAGTKDGAS